MSDIKLQHSGSCSLVCLIFDSICYIANTGDSRAISSKLKLCTQLTVDHKPNYLSEKARIISNNGSIYRNEYTPELAVLYTPEEIPFRVFPGKLSVSRTIGDGQAKIKQFGGIPGVVIATPEIFSIDLDDSIEFIILGSDGLFEKLSSQEIINKFWKELDKFQGNDLNSYCKVFVENLLNDCFKRYCLDNISIVLIGFKKLVLEFSKKILSFNQDKSIDNSICKSSKEIKSPQSGLKQNFQVQQFRRNQFKL